jgi:hypothetical protein
MRLDLGLLSQTLRHHGLALGITAGLGLSLVVGCSGKSGTSGGPAAAGGAAEEPGDSGEHAASKPAKGGDKQAAGSKRPMVGDIPLDVWLDNPIGESKKTGTAAAAAPTVAAVTPDKPMETAAAKPVPAEAPAETPMAAGGGDWASVIPLEDLQEETKTIRLELQDWLTSVQKYNGHYKDDIVAHGSVLAALGGIALEHPEKVSWKDHAAHVRDIAADMAKKSKGLGQKPFDETKKEFEKIDGLLSGNPPPDIGEASAGIPFSEIVSRRGLMKRLQTSSDSLRANYQNEASLMKDGDKAAHMASVVAAIAKVIGSEGYPNADEEDYQKFVKGLMEANVAMAKAAREKDFAAFSEANGKVGKFCGDCHAAYMGSD